MKRSAADRCNALSELLGLESFVDDVRDHEQIKAEYDQLLNQQFKVSRKEAADIMDKAMDEQYEVSRKQGRRMAGVGPTGINRGM